PAPNVAGSTTIVVTLQDNGGTDGGGIDTSLPQTFSVTITKPHAWHNALHSLDVNADGSVVPSDALAIINWLNPFGPAHVRARTSLLRHVGRRSRGPPRRPDHHQLHQCLRTGIAWTSR